MNNLKITGYTVATHSHAWDNTVFSEEHILL